jgi:hypothetical protein
MELVKNDAYHHVKNENMLRLVKRAINSRSGSPPGNFSRGFSSFT